MRFDEKKQWLARCVGALIAATISFDISAVTLGATLRNQVKLNVGHGLANTHSEEVLEVGKELATLLWESVCQSGRPEQVAEGPCSAAAWYYTIEVDISSFPRQEAHEDDSYSCLIIIRGRNENHPGLSNYIEYGQFRCGVSASLKGLVARKGSSGYPFFADQTHIPIIEPLKRPQAR